jgi:hypothetical protein
LTISKQTYFKASSNPLAMAREPGLIVTIDASQNSASLFMPVKAKVVAVEEI